MAAGLVSRHVSADGTLVRANASFKSFLPIEVALDPEEYKRRLRAPDAGAADEGPPDPGNPTVNFRGEKRRNATHRSATDPDCRFVSKGSSGTGAYPGYTVNALMENRHRFLLGLGVEIFQGTASEKAGCLACWTARSAGWGSRHSPWAPTRASSIRVRFTGAKAGAAPRSPSDPEASCAARGSRSRRGGGVPGRAPPGGRASSVDLDRVAARRSSTAPLRRGRQSQSAQVVKVESRQSQATDTGPRSTRRRSGPTLEWRERTRRRGPAQKH
jgi:hypothetical protein